VITFPAIPGSTSLMLDTKEKKVQEYRYGVFYTVELVEHG